MLKGLRSILPLYRPALRTWSRIPQYDAGYKVKRVRILRPMLTLRLVLLNFVIVMFADDKVDRRTQTAAIYLSAFAIYWHFVLDPEAEDDADVPTDRGVKSVGGEEVGANQEGAVTEVSAQGDIAIQEEIPDDAIFIPLGRARRRPKEYYKGSDQEWQSFLEFAHDKQRNALVRSKVFLVYCDYPLVLTASRSAS